MVFVVKAADMWTLRLGVIYAAHMSDCIQSELLPCYVPAPNGRGH